MKSLQDHVHKMGPEDKSKVLNTNLMEFLEFMNVLSLAEVIVTGALARQESRGAHFRVDVPERDDEQFALHTIAIQEKEQLCIDFY